MLMEKPLDFLPLKQRSQKVECNSGARWKPKVLIHSLENLSLLTYLNLEPGTLISPSHTTVPQTLGGGQTWNEEGSVEGQSRSCHVTFLHACAKSLMLHL